MVQSLVILDKTIDIQAPPEAVFHLLTRVARGPAPPPARGGAPSAPGDPLHLGSALYAVVDTVGVRLQSAQELVAFQENVLFGWRQREGDFARNEGAYALAPIPGGGTRLRLRMEVELPFVLPRLVTEAEVARDFSRRMDQTLMSVKDLLEGRAPKRGAGAAS